MTKISRDKIYIVDDDPRVLTQMIILFQNKNYDVHGFSNPQDLLNASYDPQVPAVIVSDMRMPQASGLELLRALRARGIQAPVVFVSGESTQEEIISAFEDPGVSYILKPALPSKLISMVENALVQDKGRILKEFNKSEAVRRFSTLTPTELKVYHCLLRSMSNHEIHLELGMNIESVKKHRQSIFRKYDCDSIATFLQSAKHD